ITQNALSIVDQRARKTEGELNLWNATSMFDIARFTGDALREVKTRDGPYLLQNTIASHANFIVGGQVKGEAPRLFEVYSEGNFIEATPDTCYFQIGESKYGKPVIDRVVKRSTGLLEATKCTIVSFDSTMRSNISVGLPIDLVVYETDALTIRLQRRIGMTPVMTSINPFDFSVESYAESCPFVYPPTLAKELIPFLAIAPIGPRLAAWLTASRATIKDGDNTVTMLVRLNQQLQSEI